MVGFVVDRMNYEAVYSCGSSVGSGVSGGDCAWDLQVQLHRG